MRKKGFLTKNALFFMYKIGYNHTWYCVFVICNH